MRSRHRRRYDLAPHEHRRKEDWQVAVSDLWRRAPDPPDGDGRLHPLRTLRLLLPYVQWRTSQAIQKHPIQMGFVIATVVCTLFVGVLLNTIDQLRQNTHDLRRVVVTSQIQRTNTAALFCKALNDQHQTSASQNGVLTAILVKSVNDSRRYAPALHRLGIPLPTYSVQLRRAYDEARALAATVPPPIDCRRIRREIELHIPR